MVNNDAFAIRIKKILSFYNLSAAQLADKIGVQRSSISHLLSGRNKPSLDFVLKIIKQFNEVDLYWLLNGRGKFPKQESDNSEVVTPSPIEKPAIKQTITPVKIIDPNPETNESSQIEKIIIFYKDGTFKKYKGA